MQINKFYLFNYNDRNITILNIGENGRNLYFIRRSCVFISVIRFSLFIYVAFFYFYIIYLFIFFLITHLFSTCFGSYFEFRYYWPFCTVSSPFQPSSKRFYLVAASKNKVTVKTYQKGIERKIRALENCIESLSLESLNYHTMYYVFTRVSFQREVRAFTVSMVFFFLNATALKVYYVFNQYVNHLLRVQDR